MTKTVKVFVGCVLRTRTATFAYNAVIVRSTPRVGAAHPRSFLRWLTFQNASKGSS
jgi:hypothetical protein